MPQSCLSSSARPIRCATWVRSVSYTHLRRLGKSVNDVYLARDTRENRQAALKLIKSGPDAASQLLLEAERRGAAIQQTLRTLDPRVIEVYDYGCLLYTSRCV